MSVKMTKQHLLIIENCITILLTGTSTRSPIYKTNVKYQRGDNCHKKLYNNTTNWDIHQISYLQNKCHRKLYNNTIN